MVFWPSGLRRQIKALVFGRGFEVDSKREKRNSRRDHKTEEHSFFFSPFFLLFCFLCSQRDPFSHKIFLPAQPSQVSKRGSSALLLTEFTHFSKYSLSKLLQNCEIRMIVIKFHISVELQRS